MIDHAVEVIASELNTFVASSFPGKQETQVLISELTNQDGSLKTFNDNLITLTMVNLEEEKSLRNHKQAPGTNAPVRINLYLLFCAFHSENGSYIESLRALASVIGFFQANNTLNHQNTPSLDNRIDKLVFELVNQNMQELNYTWSMQGNRYLPSVMYKARMILIQEGQVQGFPGSIAGLGLS